MPFRGSNEGNKHMRTYTIIGGVNGVGKSSFTGVLKEQCTDLGNWNKNHSSNHSISCSTSQNVLPSKIGAF